MHESQVYLQEEVLLHFPIVKASTTSSQNASLVGLLRLELDTLAGF